MHLLETTDTAYRVVVDNAERLYPRVTSVLSLVRPDLREIPADVLAHAAQRGQAVHRACWILAAEPSGLKWDTLHPECVPYVEAFEAFRKALRPVILEEERLVVSQRFGYAGRMDLLTEINGQWWITDLKTGSDHPAHHIQASAYLEAYKEQTSSKKRIRRAILYLRDGGHYRFVNCEEHSDHASDFRVFTSLLQVWRWQRNGTR